MEKVLPFISVLLLVNPCFGAAIPRVTLDAENITSTSPMKGTRNKSSFHHPDPLIYKEGFSFSTDANMTHSDILTEASFGINSDVSTSTSSGQTSVEEGKYLESNTLRPQNAPLIPNQILENDGNDHFAHASQPNQILANVENSHSARASRSPDGHFENVTEKLDQMAEEHGSSHSVHHRSKRATLTFLGDYICENRTYPTIQVYAGTFVRIYSANFPHTYPNDVKCGWKFLAEEGRKIRVLCPTFGLARGDNVYYKDLNLRPVLKYDQNLPMQNVTSVTNYIFIGLTTDERDTGIGFRCFVRTLDDVNPITAPTPTVPTYTENSVPVLVRRVGEPLNPRRDLSVIGSSVNTTPTSSQIVPSTSSQVLTETLSRNSLPTSNVSDAASSQSTELTSSQGLPNTPSPVLTEALSRNYLQTTTTSSPAEETTVLSPTFVSPESVHELEHTPSLSLASTFTSPSPTSTSVVPIPVLSSSTENLAFSSDLNATSFASESTEDTMTQISTLISSSVEVSMTDTSTASTLTESSSASTTSAFSSVLSDDDDDDVNLSTSSTSSTPTEVYSDNDSVTNDAEQFNDTISVDGSSTSTSIEIDLNDSQTVENTPTSLYPVYDSSKKSTTNAYEAYVPYWLRNLKTGYAAKPAIFSAPHTVVGGITTYIVRSNP